MAPRLTIALFAPILHCNKNKGQVLLPCCKSVFTPSIPSRTLASPPLGNPRDGRPAQVRAPRKLGWPKRWLASKRAESLSDHLLHDIGMTRADVCALSL